MKKGHIINRKTNIRIGSVFGYFTVVGLRKKMYSCKSFSGMRTYAVCRCKCGKEKEIEICNLKSGRTKSCGCEKANLMNSNKIHNTHMMSKTRLYRIWTDMKSRCTNNRQPHYVYYGKKGISVCAEWKDSFEKFEQWANKNGYSDELTIDRIDNSQGYCPDNCRWTTNKVQSRNRSSNKIVKIWSKNGLNESIPLPEAAERFRKNLELVRNRIASGWDVMEALTREKRKYNRK